MAYSLLGWLLHYHAFFVNLHQIFRRKRTELFLHRRATVLLQLNTTLFKRWLSLGYHQWFLDPHNWLLLLDQVRSGHFVHWSGLLGQIVCSGCADYGTWWDKFDLGLAQIGFRVASGCSPILLWFFLHHHHLHLHVSFLLLQRALVHLIGRIFDRLSRVDWNRAWLLVFHLLTDNCTTTGSRLSAAQPLILIVWGWRLMNETVAKIVAFSFLFAVEFVDSGGWLFVVVDGDHLQLQVTHVRQADMRRLDLASLLIAAHLFQMVVPSCFRLL